MHKPLNSLQKDFGWFFTILGSGVCRVPLGGSEFRSEHNGLTTTVVFPSKKIVP